MDQSEDWVMINFEVLHISGETEQKQVLRQINQEPSCDHLRTHNESIFSITDTNYFDDSTCGVERVVVQLPDVVQALLSNESPHQQAEAARTLRRMLCTPGDQSIQPVIDAGAVPCLVELLTSPNPTLQFEAAWALTNIASSSSEHTFWLVQQGVVKRLVHLLSSQERAICELAVWALGNIAGDGFAMRDLVISHDVVPQLLHILATQSAPSLQRNTVWTLMNLLRHKPQVDLSVAEPTLSTLAHLCSSATDEDAMSYAVWALNYVSDGPNGHVEAVIRAGAVPHLVRLLGHHSPNVVIPALRTCGNIIASGDDVQTQTLIDEEVLLPLGAMLWSTEKSMLKEACWALSTICAGDHPEQIENMFARGFILRLSEIVLLEERADVRRDALVGLCNVLIGATATQLQAYHILVENSCLPAICSGSILGSADRKEVFVALQAIESVLKAGNSLKVSSSLPSNPFCARLNQLRLPQALWALAQNENQVIKDKAGKVLRRALSLS